MRRVALALLCALPIACGGEVSKNGGDAGATAAKTKASVEIVDLAGIDAALAKFRGRGVVLNFWALWCAPCVAELPELIEASHDFEAAGGRVVLVSYDLMIPGAEKEDARRRVTDFVTKRGIEAPVLIYDAIDYEAINRRFELPGGVPVTIAIDTDGRIVDKQDGAADKPRFEAMMKKALGG
jgi:thiol-disulfide isomerase/thioredoxin